MIVHILGATGSGKTTLGNKIASEMKNVVVVDTDDIDDTNAIKIVEMKKYNNYFNDKNIGKYFDLKAKMNEIDMTKIIDDCKKNNKSLIIVGHTLTGTKLDPINYTDHKYCIDIDPEVNYKQYMSRTYDSICKNCKQTTALIKKEKNVYKLDEILIHKYKIRPSPPFLGFKDNIKDMYKNNKKNGYKIMTSDDIYRDIVKKLKI